MIWLVFPLLSLLVYSRREPTLGGYVGGYVGADRSGPAWYAFEVREAPVIGSPSKHKRFLGPKYLPRSKVVSLELGTQRKLQGTKLSHVTVRAWRYDPGVGWQRPGTWEHYA